MTHGPLGVIAAALDLAATRRLTGERRAILGRLGSEAVGSAKVHSQRRRAEIPPIVGAP